MDIESLVTKHERLIPAGAYTLAEGIRAALNEMAAGYEQERKNTAHQIDACMRDNVSLRQRIRQLEAERVPDGIVVSSEWLRRIHRDLDACQKVIWLGMRDADPSYCADAKARLKEIDAMLDAAKQPKKE